MSPVIPFRRRSRYPRVPFALGVLAAIALGAAAIAAWMIWQRSSVSPSGQIIEVIDGDTVRFNGAVYRLVGFDTLERGDKRRVRAGIAMKRAARGASNYQSNGGPERREPTRTGHHAPSQVGASGRGLLTAWPLWQRGLAELMFFRSTPERMGNLLIPHHRTSQPNRFAKVRDLGVTLYRRRIHVRLQLTCGRDPSS
jgi:hypothetical protein